MASVGVAVFTDVDDTNVAFETAVIPPQCIIDEYPLTELAHATVLKGRQAGKACLAGTDDRLLAIVGPCSIHSIPAALEYAKKLRALAEEVAADVLVVMRVYFEKPRTTIGWKGLINDPDLDNSFRINKGLRTARQLLISVNELGLPCGGEFLDTISPQFMADLFAWGAIGARTTESQLHRELASGMSMPVGFKNGTDGSIAIATDACQAARSAHHFLGVTKQGLAAIVHTKGNSHTHVILRGSSTGPNYEAAHVDGTLEQLQKKKLPEKVMIDCSHGNSSKDYRRQPVVLEDVCQQIADGKDGILGIMLESNLVEGKQDLKAPEDLVYGRSITDGCIGWAATEACLRQAANAVQARRAKRAA